MAEITKRRAGELVRGLFKLLQGHPEGLQAREVLRQLEQLVPPTDFERTAYPSRPDTRRYEIIIRFSTIAFVKAGWLTKSKGQWSVTDDGRRGYAQFQDAEEFMREASRLYREWADAQPEEPESAVESDAGTPVEPEVAATAEEAEERAWAEIETFLGAMNPYDFQELVAGLLIGMGYHVAWVSPPGADGGIDIVAHADPLGITVPRIKVQVKRRRAEKTTVEGVRSFMAILADGDVGLFVSTGGFTKDAQDEVRRQEKRRITLLNLERLFDLWAEHYDRIPDDRRRLFPLRKVWFLAEKD